MSQALVTVRVSEATKKAMDAFDQNWSQVLRDAIEERLRFLRRGEAVEAIERMAERVARRPGRERLSGEVVRWRRSRSSPTRPSS